HLDSRRLLSGRAYRRRLQMGRVPLHPAPEDETRADHCRPSALHGQFHDLHRGLRAHRRGARQLDDDALDRPRQARAWPVRSRNGRSDVDHLFPADPDLFLDFLHGDDARGVATVTEAAASSASLARAEARARARRRSWSWLVPTLYILFLMLPIYWLVNMSFKTTNEILGAFSLWPRNFTLQNYQRIFTDPVWYWGYFNSLIYVTINTVISVAVALPAAYAFSRYRFMGDKHLFFWLLTNRMAPPAIFVLPFIQLYSSVGLF